MKMLLCWVVILFFFVSCTTTSGPGLFTEKTPHQKYGRKLTDAGLDKTALGARWFEAAQTALTATQTISLPYKELGYFAADKPRAVGFRFAAKRGQRLNFNLTKNPATGFTIYADLWQLKEDSQPAWIQSMDTAVTTFVYEADKDVTLLLRLQPELLISGDYTLSVWTGPSLHFPVAGGSAKIGSFWGADRDGGSRSHEGIDVFANKGTPAVAAAAGRVTSVSVNSLGGNVVFMRPEGKDYSLYYAHLDKQLVATGQQVSIGDTLGLVGNTGNARYTASHLHFGIYTGGGAIDPFPFVNPAVQKPVAINTAVERLKTPVRLAVALRSSGNNYKAATVAVPVSVTSFQFNAMLPDGTAIQIPVGVVQSMAKALKTSRLKQDAYLLSEPSGMAPKKKTIGNKVSLAVYGYFNDFSFVKQGNEEGWVLSALLN